MAFNRVVSALVLTGLLLFTAAKPSSAQIINGLTVGGELCCTVTGNCPSLGNQNSTGVGSAAVHLDCNTNGRYVPVGVSMTTPSGSFNITVPSTKLYSFEHPTIPCVVRVQVPLPRASKCSALSETLRGALVSGLKSSGVVTLPLLGLVRNATLTGFVKTNGDN